MCLESGAVEKGVGLEPIQIAGVEIGPRVE